jgi:hypothetical protein
VPAIRAGTLGCIVCARRPCVGRGSMTRGVGTVNSVQTVVNIFDSRAVDCLAPYAASNNVAPLARGCWTRVASRGRDETTNFAVGDFRREFFTAQADGGPRASNLTLLNEESPSVTRLWTASGRDTVGLATSFEHLYWQGD